MLILCAKWMFFILTSARHFQPWSKSVLIVQRTVTELPSKSAKTDIWQFLLQEKSARKGFVSTGCTFRESYIYICFFLYVHLVFLRCTSTKNWMYICVYLNVHLEKSDCTSAIIYPLRKAAIQHVVAVRPARLVRQFCRYGQWYHQQRPLPTVERPRNRPPHRPRDASPARLSLHQHRERQWRNNLRGQWS